MPNIIYQPPLAIGETLKVRLDQDNVFDSEWTDVVVEGISVCFNPRTRESLDPYVLVKVNHPKLTCFNFTLYCSHGYVRRGSHERL